MNWVFAIVCSLLLWRDDVLSLSRTVPHLE